MEECGFNSFGKCAIQGGGDIFFKCQGTEHCPVYRIMLALEAMAFTNTDTFNFRG